MAQYRAGQWQVLLAESAVVMVAAETGYEKVTALWDQLQNAPTLVALADTLIGGGGGSFAAIPPFAVALIDAGRVRIAVRGPLEVEAETNERIERITGEDATIWQERTVEQVARLTLSAKGAEDSGLLPLYGGVVRASTVILHLDDGDAPVPAAAAGSAIAADEAAAEASPVAEDESAAEESRAAEASDRRLPREEPEPEPEPEPDPEPIISPPAVPVPFSAETLVPSATIIPGVAPGAEPEGVEVFDSLFSDTIHTPNPARPAAGDHDGATISVAQLREMRKAAPQADDAPTGILPTIPAARTGRIRLSTGQDVALDRTVVIGRRPRATRASGTDLPHLIAVESPQQDISRNHLEIRPEGDTVVVLDLHTTNGSTLLRPGADPVKLHPGEQTLVLSGDVIDLGDGVTVAFEELP